MEYGDEIYTENCHEICNVQFIKHVGYMDDVCTRSFYSKKNIDKISHKITELLMGVDKHNRPIIVPDKTICNVMSTVHENYRPETGDIYTRYNIPKERETNNIQNMIDQVINIITTDVKINLGMDECNKNLSVWTTVLGDFNTHGLQSHSKIKLRERRPQPMAFQMNY